MSVGELKAICDTKAVHKVAIVDDIFDVPDPGKLRRESYTAFRSDISGDEILKGAVERVSGQKLRALPAFEDLQEEDLSPIWRALWRSRMGGRQLSTQHRERLQALFAGHAHDVIGMLDTVTRLTDLFRRDLSRTVTAYGTDYDADEVARADIVLVDFFLGQDMTRQEALEASSKVVEAVTASARRKGRDVPSFLLVSSRPEEVDIEVFRTRSELMKSRFRFFPKDKLHAESLEDLINLHDLVDASDRAAVIEGLLDDWKAGAAKAIDAVHARMLELDIADLVYLDCFRLTHEGTTIGNYLRWFLTASLHARVTSQLSPKTWKKADGLRLFSVLDEQGELDPASLVKTFDGPSDVIAAAYGDILFDGTRTAGDQAFPAALPQSDLMEGDLFVKPRGRDRQTFAGAEVRMVMTPSCDLLPRQVGAAPAAKSVLFVPGKLRQMAEHDMDKSVKDQDFVRLKERDKWRVFQIDWDLKNPVAIDWPEITAQGVGKGFRRLGRIRDLYLHRIRDLFANTLTRVGTEVAPLFPRAKAGAVFIAVEESGKRRFEKVGDFDADAGLIWEIGPITARKPDGKSETKLLYQASRKFAPRVLEFLAKLDLTKVPIADAAAKAQAAFNDMTTLMDVVRPMKPGPRGKDGIVEFKTAGERNATPSSKSRIVVQPFLEAPPSS